MVDGGARNGGFIPLAGPWCHGARVRFGGSAGMGADEGVEKAHHFCV